MLRAIAYIKFKGVIFQTSESYKINDCSISCEHVNFKGVCIKCMFMLKENKDELFSGRFEKLGRHLK
jgi:hypothetical protein